MVFMFVGIIWGLLTIPFQYEQLKSKEYNTDKTNEIHGFDNPIVYHLKAEVNKKEYEKKNDLIKKMITGSNDSVIQWISKNVNASNINDYRITFKQTLKRYRPNTGSGQTPNITKINKSVPNSNMANRAVKDENIAISSFLTFTVRPHDAINQNCEYSKTTINHDQKVCKGLLIFEDDFNEMNWTIWERDVRIPLDSEDFDFVSFQNLSHNLYIRNGILYILPKLLPKSDETHIREGKMDLGSSCTAIIDRKKECEREAGGSQILPPIVSARIITKQKFSFKYGIIEIRAKLPKGDWLFPQLFLEPTHSSYGYTEYLSGQIRLAFIRSNEILNTKEGKQIDGHCLFGGVVLSPGEKCRETWMKHFLDKKNHFGDDYHIYKTKWTDEYIKFYVDGTEYGVLHGNFKNEASNLHNIINTEHWKNGNKMAPFDKEFYLSFGVSAGGISDFPDNSTSGTDIILDLKPWQNLDVKNALNFWKAAERWHTSWNGENVALKIDYVRVWAL